MRHIHCRQAENTPPFTKTVPRQITAYDHFLIRVFLVKFVVNSEKQFLHGSHGFSRIRNRQRADSSFRGAHPARVRFSAARRKSEKPVGTARRSRPTSSLRYGCQARTKHSTWTLCTKRYRAGFAAAVRRKRGRRVANPHTRGRVCSPEKKVGHPGGAPPPSLRLFPLLTGGIRSSSCGEIRLRWGLEGPPAPQASRDPQLLFPDDQRGH